jgi:hypothetical protein
MPDEDRNLEIALEYVRAAGYVATVEELRGNPAVDELARLRADYRTLWGMTLGHDGQPPAPGTADEVGRLRARYIQLDGTADGN